MALGGVGEVNGAEGVLILNVGVAGLFASGYAILALGDSAQRRALGFAVSYLIGMISPLSDLATPRLGAPVLTEWASYLSFLVATASISIAYTLFHRQAAPWRAVVAIVILGAVTRAAIGAQPQDTLAYGLAYQAPFALAAMLAARTVLSLRAGARHLTNSLGGVFALIAVLDLLKPVMALLLGSGRTLETYTQTAYALASQLSSGLLLLAAGLLLLLIVAQKAVTESHALSETDPLSGLLNRRGFDRLASQRLAAAHAGDRPLAAAMFDLDHFKQINDRHGHAVGDAVIVAAAKVLTTAAPPGALVGRMGGEEFALVLADLTAAQARQGVERLRVGLSIPPDNLPRVTASCGIAQLRPGETLSDLMRRADLAAYDAKRAGRDQLCDAERLAL